MPIVIKELDPKTGKPKKKMPLPKKKPRRANPNHPMNSERTTGHPDGVARKKAGGKLKMVEKGGKKVPFYAADGVGKMAKGGYTNKDGRDIDIKKFPGMKGKPISPATRKILGVKKKASGGSMKIKSGDTLSQIAKSKGLTLKSLMAANPGIKNANEIRVGQSIKMPTGGAKTRSQIAFQNVDKNLNRRDNVYAGMTKSSMKALADDTTAKRAKKVVASSGGKKRIRRRKGADLPEQANKRARVTTRLNQLGEINKQRRAADADKKPRKVKRSRPAIPSNDIAAKKGGVMKAKGYKHGGKMCRGGGAATRGKRYGKAG